eukprot:2176248-Pyramimonas_sp.AAC.1
MSMVARKVVAQPELSGPPPARPRRGFPQDGPQVLHGWPSGAPLAATCAATPAGGPASRRARRGG